MSSSLRKCAGIPSGPVALWGFRLCKRLATPSTETDAWVFLEMGNHSFLAMMTDLLE